MQKCVFRWLDEDGHIDTIEETVYEIALFNKPAMESPQNDPATTATPG